MAPGEEEVEEIWDSRWSDISEDLLDRIVKKLIRPSDYIRFRGVCKPWRSVAKPSDLPRRLPLVMLPYDPASHLRSVFSLSTNQVHTLSIPALVNKVILTASGGWLLVLDVAPEHGRLFLFNPVTGAEIRLPPTNGFVHTPGFVFSPAHQKFLSISHGIHYTVDLSDYVDIFPWHAFLLWGPDSSQRDCMVVISECYPRDSDVAFCKLGDESWTALNTGLRYPPVSVVHHEGSLYAIDVRGNASVCKLAAPGEPELMDLPANDGELRHYINLCFVTTSTQMFLFACYEVAIVPEFPDDEDMGPASIYFRTFCAIFELKPGNPPEWSRVNSIHDNTVFRSCQLFQNFSLCSRDIRGLRKDSIYLVGRNDFSYHLPGTDFHETETGEIDVLDLKTGDYEHVSFGSWERPPRRLQLPFWLELSLHKTLEQRSPVQVMYVGGLTKIHPGDAKHHRVTLEDRPSGDTIEGDAPMALYDTELAFMEKTLLEHGLMMVGEEGEDEAVENGDNHLWVGPEYHGFTQEDPPSGDTIEGDAPMALYDTEHAFVERTLLENGLMMVDEEGEGGAVESRDNHLWVDPEYHEFTLEDPPSGDTIEGDAPMALYDAEHAFVERTLLENGLMMVDEEGEGGAVESRDNHLWVDPEYHRFILEDPPSRDTIEGVDARKALFNTRLACVKWVLEKGFMMPAEEGEGGAVDKGDDHQLGSPEEPSKT